MENKTQYAIKGYEVRSKDGKIIKRFRYFGNAVSFAFKKISISYKDWNIEKVYYNGVAK